MYERYQQDSIKAQDFHRQMAEKQAYAARLDAQMQGAASLGGGIKQDPQTPLESALGSINIAMQNAFSALERLADGMHSVLQPEVPMPADTNGNAFSTPPTSPVVSQLNSLRDQLDVLTSRMNALRCRLDA